jgi:Tfp pilus assembly protein PilZ
MKAEQDRCLLSSPFLWLGYGGLIQAEVFFTLGRKIFNLKTVIQRNKNLFVAVKSAQQQGCAPGKEGMAKQL